jgi:LytS/YehU family sensor histidine kinase
LQKELISKKLVLSQLEALRSQMNPHFIFNALNSIQEYIVFNNKELASSYLIKFSRLIRIYLEHSQQNEIVLKEEISALKIYLELEKVRFEDVLDYDLQIDESLSLEQIKIPSLFIQPYVENAIKHGLLHKLNDRMLKVTFRRGNNEGYLICTIEDNGIGRSASLEINKNKTVQHQSFATSANEKRLELINLDRAEKIVVEIVDLYSNNNESKGTKVIIKIPLNK